ncbi:MAG: pyridoxine 5'-phosphate synthase [Saprospiraceae bacterium]|nr:pyridoxine 5'-phosphate synthase [Saprospiraceae bacterium]
MTRLSVNINKVALIRNARGGDLPDLIQVAKDCESFGADGITVHPRPDQRHIRFDDLLPLKKIVTTEFNVEGYPSDHFLKLMEEVRPDQCTLVPDDPGVLTSSEGWDVKKHKDLLKDVVRTLTSFGARVSIFLDPNPEMVEHVADIGAHRIELYTGDYAKLYGTSEAKIEIEKHKNTAEEAEKFELGVNAGHDLNLVNLKEYNTQIVNLLEVSIGHALICDALYLGLKNTILSYKRQLN